MAAPLSGQIAVHAQTPANSSRPEFRKAFLEKFPWTELCTTPEDAMVLRILIESRVAKRGVEVGGEVVEGKQLARFFAPKHGHPPAVGENLRLAHADPSRVSGLDFQLAQE